MRIDLVSKNYKESSRLTEVIEKKLSRLDKFFSEDAFAKIQLTGLKGDRYTMEISIKQPGMPVPVRAEVTTDNMYDNIDVLIPKLEKQILKYRSRFDKKSVKLSFPDIKEDIESEEAPAYNNVVKIKKFDISIITVDEAIAELELLDHNFYVFVNAEDNKVSVVYKRHDGDYGLITPEY